MAKSIARYLTNLSNTSGTTVSDYDPFLLRQIQTAIKEAIEQSGVISVRRKFGCFQVKMSGRIDLGDGMGQDWAVDLYVDSPDDGDDFPLGT